MLDTHALYWYWTDPSRLGSDAEAAFTALEAKEAIGVVPVLVLAELLYAARKQGLAWTMEWLLGLVDGASALRLEAMTRQHLVAMDQLNEIPEMHDRLIAAVGLLHGAEVITRDPDIHAHPAVRSVW